MFLNSHTLFVCVCVLDWLFYDQAMKYLDQHFGAIIIVEQAAFNLFLRILHLGNFPLLFMQCLKNIYM